MMEDGFEVMVDGPEAMIELGRQLASELEDGSVLALCGGLGAGKTHLTKGLVAGLGCPAEVTSPTFSLAHEYQGGRLDVFHFDFYRMDSLDEVIRIGWDDYLESQGVIIVEWPDKFSELLPPSTIWLELRNQGESRVVRYVSQH